LKEAEMAKVAGWIARVLREGETAVPEIRAQVETMMAGYPLYA
jgi:glycine hydroxymethyltransferase